MKVLCGVLSGGSKCCSPVICACVCAASSSQVVAVSGSFRSVSSSEETVAAERSPLVCESELCLSSLPQSVLYSTSCCHRFDQVWPIEAVEFLKFGCV